MKAYILRTGTTITPFGDDVADSQVLNQSLSACQRRACQAAGLDWQRIDSLAEAVERPCLLALDSLYFSEKVLGDFLSSCKKKGTRSARLALTRSPSVEYSLGLQDTELIDWQGPNALAAYDLWLVEAGDLPGEAAALRSALSARCPPLAVPMREIGIPVRLPLVKQKEHSFIFPITSSACCNISHWTHLLWLAHLSLGIAWMEHLRENRIWSTLSLLATVVRKPSINKWKVLAGMNSMGRGVDVHPTAYMEASILGDGVRVGAGACIRNSIIGPDVVVSDHAKVVNSVVGQACLLTEDYFLLNSLCYPGSILGNPKTQMAVIGRDVYLSGWTSLLDAKFEGDVQVIHRGQKVGTGKAFLACCIGHRAVLGARVLIHPGREIPNDLLMVSRPEDVVAHIPPDLPANTPLVRHEGGLVPLKNLSKRPT